MRNATLSVAAAAVLTLGAGVPQIAHAQTVPPLGLREAIALALEHSPSLRPANDRVMLSEIQRQVAEAEFNLKVTPSFGSGTNPYGLDQQTLGVSLSKKLITGAQVVLNADSSQWSVGGNGSAPMRDGGYALNIVQPLLRGAGPTARAGLIDGRREVERSDRHLRESRQQIIVDVAATYFSIIRHKRLVGTSELALERAVRLRTASQARARVGLATQLDVLRAELLASRSEADVETEREALSSALDLLKLALGRSPESLLDVAEADIGGDPFGVERVVSQPVDELVKLAIATRPDVFESRERIGDARRHQAIAKWNLLPDLSLTMSYARRGLGSPQSRVLNDLMGGWKVGVSSSYSLDNAVQAASAASAGIELIAAEQEAIHTQRRVAADVRRAHRAWLRTADSIAIQQKTVEFAGKQLQLAQLRYERGIANNFDIIDAEHQVAQTQAALISAQVDRQMAGLMLLRAMGTLSLDESAEDRP